MTKEPDCCSLMYNNDLLFLCIFIHNKLFKLIIIIVVQLAR